MVVMGTAMVLPLGVLAQRYRDVPSWSTDTWLAAAFLGVFSTGVAYVLFFWAVRRFGASLAATVAYFTPITALLLAFVILAERPVPLQVAGRRGDRARGAHRRAQIATAANT
ncbi:MAG: DMT family transporter [Chloroflexota bacterium]|nr:DMT family transporter [Chloroflexota bacterium]